MISRVEAEIETLPSHDRVRAKKLIYEAKREVNVKTLAELLLLLSRYGFRLKKGELNLLLKEILENSSTREVYT
ncbi:MAG: hypothetical protein DRO36_07470 [Candidatus Hecatellales archaeon]|nr:MAG: hypothetical protein DRO36_07470 [Candidatus Hecatellales archaeon]